MSYTIYYIPVIIIAGNKDMLMYESRRKINLS